MTQIMNFPKPLENKIHVLCQYDTSIECKQTFVFRQQETCAVVMESITLVTATLIRTRQIDTLLVTVTPVCTLIKI